MKRAEPKATECIKNYIKRMLNLHLKETNYCPKCKTGMLLIKINKNYQPFLSCDSFPECKFACNLMPEDYKNWIDKNKI